MPPPLDDSICIIFYKPHNVLTQFTGEAGDRTLKEFINIPFIYAVGRLDRDSEGLVLLTNDGVLQHRLSHPKFDKDKTYWVQVEGIPTEEALTQLRRGIQIQDYVTKPCKVKLIPDPDVPPRDPPVRYRKEIPSSWIEITITEGKNRQVRRMTAAIGYPTLRLIRIAIGPLRVDGLAPGQWRQLTALEAARL